MSFNVKEKTDAYLSLETENVFSTKWLLYIFFDCFISLQIAEEKLPILGHTLPCKKALWMQGINSNNNTVSTEQYQLLKGTLDVLNNNALSISEFWQTRADKCWSFILFFVQQLLFQTIPSWRIPRPLAYITNPSFQQMLTAQHVPSHTNFYSHRSSIIQ